MKTKLSFALLILALSPAPLALSQIPQGFNYQAIARDASGTSIANTPLPVRITIQADSLGTTILWQELHQNIVTNNLGMINLVVGKGARQTTSALASFSDIDWSVSPKFIKTEIDYGGWKTMGVSRLWSVPYSLVAEDLAGAVKKLTVTGETENMEEPLFEVKNKSGQTIFAVYNEGVRIYVSDGDAKGLKGGFAVGGFGTDKAESTKYLYVDKDSVRIYLDTNPLTKGLKGGFAVGGYDLTKGKAQDYLRVTADSTRIYVDNNPAAKKQKGGFAVGGFDATKGPEINFISLTPENYFIGHESGEMLTTGLFNSTMGYQSGKNITGGVNNAFVGYQSGFSNKTGNNNLFLGYQSGFNNIDGHLNSFIGYKAGYSNTTGDQNTFLGSSSGWSNETGRQNTFVGYDAGNLNNTGSYNNFFGTQSGYSNKTGNYNTFLGPLTGRTNITGSSNVYIGYQAGHQADSSMDNVFIGTLAGYGHSTEVHDLNSGGNVYIGSRAGQNDYAGARNVFVGWQSGMVNTTGYSNVFISSASGMDNTTGYSNVLIGDQAGRFNTTGYENVIIGRVAGLSNTSGSRNVYIGYNAGVGINANNRLCIGPGNATTSLIYGEFDNKLMRINGDLTLNGDMLFPSGANRYLTFPDGTFTLFVGGEPAVTQAPYALCLVTNGPGSTANVGLMIKGTEQNVAIGNTSPQYKLDVAGNRIRLYEPATNDWIAMRTDGSPGFLDFTFSGGQLVMQGSNTDEHIILNPTMNRVGIKTWLPQYDLDVDGSIRATGSVYYGGTDGSANGVAYSKPDFVFGKDYPLLSTEEVKTFLAGNRHLPWVTSAIKEKEENGNTVDMTRMAFETLETIENLQLQIIMMNDRMREMEEIITAQQKEINKIRKKAK